MDDFRVVTSLTRVQNNQWRAMLYDDWSLWGPAGGVLTALALRAAGEATSFPRPISFACQFLSIAKFASLDLIVTSLRAGKRSEALRVELVQNDRLILTAQVWVADDGESRDMMVHDYCEALEIPAPDNLQSYQDIYPDRTLNAFMSRMEQRPVQVNADGDLTPREPELQSLFRWAGGVTSDNPFIDGGRVMMFMDTHAWLATYAAHPVDGPSPWIAPNLDYYYQFHRHTGADEWLYMKNRADLACHSLIATQGEIRDLKGQMLVRGYAKLLCSLRPEQFK